MKSLFSIGSGLVTLLLATNPTNAEIPVWQFWEENVGSKTCPDCKECFVNSNFAEMPFGVKIGNATCEDLNGRMGAGTEYGTLIVDFSPTVQGATGVYMDFPNGTWIGGIAPSKAFAAEANINLEGTGQWGSANYIGSWCVANVVQHQKVNASADATDPEGQYSYDINLFDNGTPRNWIGGTTGGRLYVQDGKTQGLDSKLPQVFEITSGNVDDDPYYMSYYNPYLPSPSNEVWSAYDSTHQCGLQNVVSNGGAHGAWGYANGARTNNCGFPC